VQIPRKSDTISIAKYCFIHFLMFILYIEFNFRKAISFHLFESLSKIFHSNLNYLISIFRFFNFCIAAEDLYIIAVKIWKDWFHFHKWICN